ncbi:MAG: VacJ family lipoprotein [Thermodesulfobacteriota bacterium]
MKRTARATSPARFGALLCCAVVLGCVEIGRAQATAPDAAATAAAARDFSGEPIGAVDDPWEPFNRAMFEFNEELDEYVLKPVATGWDFVLPRPVQRGVDNFFDNLKFPVRFVNDLLQGELDPAAITLSRFAVNTTVGIGGIFDWASDMGLPKHSSDFGQTLGRWGVPPGPYIVWPVFGSSNPRDTVGLVADSYLDIATLFGDLWTLAGARVVQTVNTRSLLLDDVDAARAASLDFYIAVRSAYTQRRQRLIGGESETERGTDDELYFPDYSDEEVLP